MASDSGRDMSDEPKSRSGFLSMYRGAWIRPAMESSLPHEIVDSDGRRRVPMPGYSPFKSRAAATRWLHHLIHRYDKRRADSRNDPRTWVVRPIKEGV